MNVNQMAELEQREWMRTNPQQSSATIQQLHAEVWAFRREMSAYFPTPHQADSLAFAFTEIAEAVDATLRQNPVYKRNQTKEHSVERELAQCAMMLLTAIPEGWGRWRMIPKSGRKRSLSWVAATIGVAYDEFELGRESVFGIEDILEDILYAIAHMMDLPLHLRAELARMRTKHGPVQDDGPASLNAVENEHVIYTQPTEGLGLNDSEWWEESPVYKLNDYTEGMKP